MAPSSQEWEPPVNPVRFNPVERSRWQMIWLLVVGRPLQDVAAVTGYSTRWIRAVVKAYNAQGPAAVADQRHRNAGAAPLLDAAGRQALDDALQKPPSDGGLWTGRKVARWIAERLGRPPGAIPPKRGSVYLRRLDYTPRVPRPRHAKAADPAAQAVFQKRSTRRLQKNAPRRPTGSSSSGRRTSTGRA
jgi:Winged helix-turn helix